VKPDLAIARDAYEALIEAIGTPQLGDVLLQIADGEAGIDEVFGFWVEGSAPPVQIASSGRTGSSLARAALFTSRFHGLDPLAALYQGVPEGEGTRHGRIVAAEIEDPIYRRECFDRPGLTEKISFARARGGRHFVLSFYRSRARHPAAGDALSILADIALPILLRHAELLGDELGLPITERIERKVARAYPLLTQREKQVCARSLLGMTAEAIALDLSIGTASALTYRRRAYGRYRLSSVGQMVARIIG
jgi:DNA-binding CsgD family transcriptional regulator